MALLVVQQILEQMKTNMGLKKAMEVVQSKPKIFSRSMMIQTPMVSPIMCRLKLINLWGK